MKIAIVGSGAMGSLFAALLSLVRAAKPETSEIWLVGSPSTREHIQAVETGGLGIEIPPRISETMNSSIIETARLPLQGVRATLNPEEVFPADLALVLVKSYRTGEAARQVKTLLKPGGIVLSLQNGLGNQEQLEAAGLSEVLTGVTTLGANLIGPGKVRWTGLGTVEAGLPPNRSSETGPLIQEFFQRLNYSGIYTHLNPDIKSLIWGKLIMNCGINPLTALLGLTNGQLLERPPAVALLKTAVEEAAGVARVLGIELPFPFEEAVSRTVVVCNQTYSNINSMLADIRKGKPTEIQAINGAVVRIASGMNFPVPVNRTLTQLVEALAQGGSRPPDL